MMTTNMLPCPFCGAGTTEIMPNGRTWTGMNYSAPVSWSVLHWCSDIPGPSRMIERVGRDKAQAIARWNMRDGKEAAEQAEQRGDMELAGKIRKFQFRDARPNAASEMKLEDAQRLLGHSKEQIEGCPKCRQCGTIIQVCDEPGCWNHASCGVPTPDGYRSTCGNHIPRIEK